MSSQSPEGMQRIEQYVASLQTRIPERGKDYKFLADSYTEKRSVFLSWKKDVRPAESVLVAGAIPQTRRALELLHIDPDGKDLDDATLHKIDEKIADKVKQDTRLLPMHQISVALRNLNDQVEINTDGTTNRRFAYKGDIEPEPPNIELNYDWGDLVTRRLLAENVRLLANFDTIKADLPKYQSAIDGISKMFPNNPNPPPVPQIP